MDDPAFEIRTRGGRRVPVPAGMAEQMAIEIEKFNKGIEIMGEGKEIASAAWRNVRDMMQPISSAIQEEEWREERQRRERARIEADLAALEHFRREAAERRRSERAKRVTTDSSDELESDKPGEEEQEAQMERTASKSRMSSRPLSATARQAAMREEDLPPIRADCEQQLRSGAPERQYRTPAGRRMIESIDELADDELDDELADGEGAEQAQKLLARFHAGPRQPGLQVCRQQTMAQTEETTPRPMSASSLGKRRREVADSEQSLEPEDDLLDFRLLRPLVAGQVGKKDEILGAIDLPPDDVVALESFWEMLIEKGRGAPFLWERWSAGQSDACLVVCLFTRKCEGRWGTHGGGYACEFCLKQKRPCLRVKVEDGDPVAVAVLPEHGKTGAGRFQYWEFREPASKKQKSHHE
ncbi:unnamed protein product [Zymoseptoria tritici ST99CH_3D7]|uniref:Uncharacterized protein n=1 Tax=Zymoseptoria tritici (strain ST99CH_3D7) TaxID=1276538 RepID=A0A1X7RXP9_ZYMT9|nr:unnamed protein product [Zymoseptoria tritici ST99CH_3D7]